MAKCRAYKCSKKEKNMDFITWWFVSHYIWALILTPGWSFLYALYADFDGSWIAVILARLLFSSVLGALAKNS